MKLLLPLVLSAAAAAPLFAEPETSAELRGFGVCTFDRREASVADVRVSCAVFTTSSPEEEERDGLRNRNENIYAEQTLPFAFLPSDLVF